MPVARESSRPLGVVYTPPEVARAMVELALEPVVAGRSSTELLALRVCDPALGEGAFLLEVAAVLATHVHAAWRREGVGRGAEEARRAVVGGCVFGVDIDARAVAAARGALAGAGHALRVADALELDWPAAFPAVFERGGFDLVLGNPPYIRQELLRDKSALRGFASYDGVADLYVYFVELAHRLVRAGGRYCFITPNKWLTAAYGRGLRQFLAEVSTVEGVVDLGRARVFSDADAFPSIVWGTAGAPRHEPIRAGRFDGYADLGHVLRSGTPHDRARWCGAPWHIDAPADRALIDRLEAAWPALGSLIGRPARGIVTGCNRAFVIDRSTRDRLLAAEPAAAALVRPFVKGRDLRRWRPAATERFILLVGHGTSLEALPVLEAHLAAFRTALEPRPIEHVGPWAGRKPARHRWFELQDPVGELAASCAPRMFYQDIQTTPVFCLDEDGLVPDTTVWILPSADRYLLAVLCSSFYGWYARRRFPPALGGAVRPKLEYIRALPIATPAPTARAAIERLVEHRLAIEPTCRAGDPLATRTARELDAALDTAVLDVYDLTAAERAQILA